jgi:hypothetical protein
LTLENRKGDERSEKALERQFELVQAIYDLTTRQREAILTEDWDGLKTILDEKDHRIHQFLDTETCLKELGSPKGTGQRDPCLDTALSRIESKFVAIQSMEDECRRALTDRKNQVARNLQEIKRGHQRVKQFKTRGLKVPRFVDLRK